MQARQLPFNHGWDWLRQGFALWRRNPALLTFATFGYLLTLLLISAVPLLGQPIASLLMPVLSLGVLNACRAVDEGRRVGPDILFSGFKNNVQALITVGGIYLIGNLLVLMITMAVDGGVLMSVLSGAAKGDTDALEQADLTRSLLVAVALSTPVLMAYWFAPILVGWWKVSAPKAMFFSFIACARNWRPFLALGIALMVVGGLLPGVIIGTASVILPFLGTLLFLLIPLVMVPVTFASFYINAREVFSDTAHDDDPDDTADA
ncbi:MAG: BPSS1780 family membrane protein [Rhodocyclaceae bacterium]